jgi:hypothetical protein
VLTYAPHGLRWSLQIDIVTVLSWSVSDEAQGELPAVLELSPARDPQDS